METTQTGLLNQVSPAPFLRSRLVDSYTPLPQPQVLSVPQRGLWGPLTPKEYWAEETDPKGGRQRKGGGQPSFSTSPPPSQAERKGRGCVQINGVLMGRQVGGQAPSRKSPRAGALSAPRVRSSLPAGASVSASGKWAIAQAHRPRLCRRVLGSPAQSRTLGVWKPACSGSVEPAAGTPGKAVPERAPTATPLRPRGIPSLGPPQTDPSLRGPPAASPPRRALWIKYIHIYIFNCHSLLSRKGQRALGPRGGQGSHAAARGRSLRWGWRWGPSGARRQTRVSLRPGSRRPATPGPARSAEFRTGASSSPSACAVLLPMLREAAAAPCLAWP